MNADEGDVLPVASDPRRYDHVVNKSSLSLRVAAVSLDCRDHEELARFYADLLAGRLLWTHESSAAVESDGLVCAAPT
jgi:hypothetical protein